jgi:hypothetical protein
MPGRYCSWRIWCCSGGCCWWVMLTEVLTLPISGDVILRCYVLIGDYGRANSRLGGVFGWALGGLGMEVPAGICVVDSHSSPTFWLMTLLCWWLLPYSTICVGDPIPVVLFSCCFYYAIVSSLLFWWWYCGINQYWCWLSYLENTDDIHAMEVEAALFDRFSWPIR